MSGKQLIMTDTLTVPMMKSVEPKRHEYRFEMGKLKLMQKDREEELEANRLKAKKEREETEATLKKDNVPGGLTVEQVAQLPPLQLNISLYALPTSLISPVVKHV
eukprot:3267984-Amphidinium_carterae.1